MKINCTSCGDEINLSNSGFENYVGPVKCFCCGTMMEIKTIGGLVYSINPLSIGQVQVIHNDFENTEYISK